MFIKNAIKAQNGMNSERWTKIYTSILYTC